MKQILLLTTLLLSTISAFPQLRARTLPYGDMDSWTVRKIKESPVIGGGEKTLYEIGPDTLINGRIPYANLGNSPWATSNVMAKVMGVYKTNTSVFREHRKHGWSARLETRIEKVKVLGLFNIKVLAAGAIYLGHMDEPVTGMKNAEKNVTSGIPFTARPKALIYDYKFQAAGSPDRIKLTGIGGRSTIKGCDKGIVTLYLQKRREHPDGSITAERVATLVVLYDRSTGEWIESERHPLRYGDISGEKDFNRDYEDLRVTGYAANKKGEKVEIRETEWAAPDETPTHIVLQFASSHGGAYIGSPGNTLWVDNVRLEY